MPNPLARLFTILFVTLLATVTTTSAAEPSVQRTEFGNPPHGPVIDAYTLTNTHGATARVITYGAILADLRMPDRQGRFASVVREVTYSDTAYARSFPQAAMVVGRVANRIANARFTLDGREYRLEPNNGPHSIHGGKKGFSKVIWHAEPVPTREGAAVKLSYTSVGGEEGYPGTLNVSVTYTLTNENSLRLDFSAITDKPTPVNLTNHAYFNLSLGADVADDVLLVNANSYTVFDAALIPTGEIKPVADTPLDFRTPLALGARAGQLGDSHRFDQNLVLNRREGDPLSLAARMQDPKSGRVLEVWTTEPGVQLYTSLLGVRNPASQPAFFCLETQHFPDSVHHDNFPSTILRPGQIFRSTTEYRFSTDR